MSIRSQALIFLPLISGNIKIGQKRTEEREHWVAVAWEVEQVVPLLEGWGFQDRLLPSAC